MSNLTMFEGAAGIDGYENAYSGFGADAPIAPPGGRPPYAVAPGPVYPVPQYEPPAQESLLSAKNLLVGLAVVVGGYYLLKSMQSPEEMAANDDDDGEDYESNSSRSRVASPMSRNGSDEDDDDDEDEDEDDEDDDDEDEDDDFAMNASPAKEEPLVPNKSNAYTTYKQKGDRILAELDRIRAQNGG